MGVPMGSRTWLVMCVTLLLVASSLGTVGPTPPLASTEGGEGAPWEDARGRAPTTVEFNFSVRNPSDHTRPRDVAWVELAAPPGVLTDPDDITLVNRDTSNELLLGHLPDDVTYHADGSVHRVKAHFADSWGPGETRNYRAIMGQTPRVTGAPMNHQVSGEFIILGDNEANVEYQVHMDNSVQSQYQGLYYIYIVNYPVREVRAHGSALVRIGGNQLDPDQASFQMYWGRHTTRRIQGSPLMTRITLTYDQPEIVHWGPSGATFAQIVRYVDFVSAEIELTFYKGMPRVDVRSTKVINERFWNHNGFVMEFTALVGTGQDWAGEFEVFYGSDLRKVFRPSSTTPTWTLQDSAWQGIDVGANAHPAMADLDADGDLDMVIGGAQGNLTVLENVGSSTSPQLVPNASWATGLPQPDFAAPSLGDVDGDGDHDMVLGMWDGYLRVYRNDGGPSGPPTWSRWWGHFDRLGLDHYTTPCFGDADGDGDLDILVGLEKGTLEAFVNTGTSTSPQWVMDRTWVDHLNKGNTRTPAERYSCPQLSDLDYDGDLDLFLGSDDGKVTYFENMGGPGTPKWTRLDVSLFAGIGSGTWDGPNCTPAMADVDGDGDRDLVYGVQSGQVRLYTFDGNTTAYRGHYNVQPLLNGSYRMMRDKDGNDGPFVVEGYASEFYGYYALANPRTNDALLRYIPDFDRLAYKHEYWGDSYPYAGGNVSYYPYEPEAREWVTRAQITNYAMNGGVGGGTFISQTGTSAGFVMQPMTAMSYESQEILLLDVPRQTDPAGYDRYAEDLRYPLEVLHDVDLSITRLWTDPPMPGDGEPTTVFVEVTNTGNRLARNVQVDIDVVPSDGGDGIYLKYFGPVDLSSGSSVVFNRTWDTWGWTGEATIIAEVDRGRWVNETDDHNNVMKLGVTVTPNALPWSEPMAATTGINSSHHCDMVVLQDGRLYTVWETVQGFEDIDLEGRAYDPSTDTWGSLETIVSRNHYAVEPDLALKDDVLWLAYSCNIEELRNYHRTRMGKYYWSEKFDLYAMYMDQGWWSDPVRVTRAVDYDDSDHAPEIVFGANALRIYFRNTHFDFYTGGNQMNNIPFQEMDPREATYDGSSWDTGNATLSMTAGSQAWYGGPRAAPEGDGLVWVVYSTEVGNSQWDLIVEARSATGLVRQVRLTQSSNVDEVRPAIATSSRGPKVLVAYEVEQNGNRDIAVRWRNASADPASGWSKEKLLTTDPGSDMKPAVVSDDKGNYWVAWESTRTGNKDIFISRFDGTRWYGPYQVTSHPASDEQVALAIDAATGRVFAGWETDRNGMGNKDIYIRHYMPVRPILQLNETGPINGFEDRPIVIRGDVIDPNGDFHSIIWDWGDGNVSESQVEESGAGYGLLRYERSGRYTVTAVARDRYGFESDPVSIDVIVGNLPPHVEINGTADVNEDEEASLGVENISDTRSDIPSLEVQWDFGEGTVTNWLPYKEAMFQERTYSASGIYVVSLTVRDDDNATATDVFNVTVHNVPPVVTAWGRAEDLEEDEPGEFGGHAEDTPSDFARGLSFQWDWGDGTWSDVMNDPVTTHAYAASGTYVAVLYAYDDDGDDGWAIVNVSVGNIPPELRLEGPTGADEDEEVTLVAHGEDTPSDLLSLEYRWEWGDGQVTDWSAEANGSHGWASEGMYEVKVHVRDDDGQTDVASHFVSVTNVAPVAIATVNQTDVPEGMVIHFSGANSTDTPSDLPGLRFRWDLGDGEEAFEAEFDHVFLSAGLKIVELTVTDDDGKSSRTTLEVLVINRPPVARGEVSRQELKVGEFVTLDASGSSDDSWDMDGLQYIWSLGDGTTLYGVNVTHAYGFPGTYTVVLTVKDGDKDVGKWDTTVIVHPEKEVEDDEGVNVVTIAAAGIGALVVLLLLILFLIILPRRRMGAVQEAPGDELPPDEIPQEEGIMPSSEGEEGLGDDALDEGEPESGSAPEDNLEERPPNTTGPD